MSKGIKTRPWLVSVDGDEGEGGSAPEQKPEPAKAETRDNEKPKDTSSQDGRSEPSAERERRELEELEEKFAAFGGVNKAVARLQAEEDAHKTAEQRAAAAEAKAEQATADARKWRVAAEHGITGEYLALLAGKTETELTRNAELLGGLIAAKNAQDQANEREKSAGQGQPRLRGRPGAAGAEQGQEPTPEDEAAEAARRRGRIKPQQQQ